MNQNFIFEKFMNEFKKSTENNVKEPEPTAWGYVVFYVFTVIYVGIALYLDFWYSKQQKNEEANRSRNSDLYENFN